MIDRLRMRCYFANCVEYIRNKSIRTKIFLFFIILNILSFAILYVFVYDSYHKSTLRQTEFLSGEVLKNIELNIDLVCNELMDLSLQIYSTSNLNSLSIDYYNQSNSSTDSNMFDENSTKSTIENILRQYVDTHKYIKSIRLYIKDTLFCAVKDGNFLVKAGEASFLPPWSDKVYQADGKPLFIPTYRQLYSQNLVSNSSENIISLARVVKNLKQIYENERVGMLVIDFEESYLQNLFSNMNLSTHNFTIICTNEGKIISATDDTLIGKNILSEKLLDNIPQEKSGNIFSSVKAQNYLISYNTYSKLGWKIITYIPSKDLLLASTTFNQTVLILIVICVLANLLISYIITKVISNPIKRLITTIKKIDGGNLTARIKIVNQDEIGKIGVHFNKMVDSIETLLKENYVVHLKEKEAQIKSLQAQINPHFLYNTLDTISWKVMLMGGDDVSKIVSSLGEILRYSIGTHIKFVTLEQDIQQVKNYLFIQKIRYEDRFQVYFHLSPCTLKFKVNKLLIQPIVENAIQHGLENKEYGGILCLSSKVRDEKLIIEVFDNGCGISEERIQEIFDKTIGVSPENTKNHVGINNVHERIQLYYGINYGVEIKSKPGKYTKMILKLPIVEEDCN